MNTDHNLLVIVPDEALRRSLVFMLETEGYRVTAHAALPPMPLALYGPIACIVVDDAAVAGVSGGWEQVTQLAGIVVVVLSNLGPPPEVHGHLVVEKPLLGKALLETIEAALARVAAST